MSVTGSTHGLSQDYNRGLGRWFADRLGAREQLRKDMENKQEQAAQSGMVPLTIRALRAADMALASWENGYAFDAHGPSRECQRLITEALAAAPQAVPLTDERSVELLGFVRGVHGITAKGDGNG